MQRVLTLGAAGVLTLTAMKRLLGKATDAGRNGSCMKYCGHWTCATRLAPCRRPLTHHLNWRHRNIAVGEHDSKLTLAPLDFIVRPSKGPELRDTCLSSQTLISTNEA